MKIKPMFTIRRSPLYVLAHSSNSAKMRMVNLRFDVCVKGRIDERRLIEFGLYTELIRQ